jgi:hypothetical protein
VACVARGYALRSVELPSVNVFMAARAERWRLLEGNSFDASFWRRRQMAVQASRRAMRLPQRKGSGGMIEVHNLTPLCFRVARCAVPHCPLIRCQYHRLKLTPMRVAMTAGARAVHESELLCGSAGFRHRCRVALAADYRFVSARKGEKRLVVLSE